MNSPTLHSIIERYQAHGFLKAGELLLPPQEALRMLDELVQANIRIIGIDTWKIEPAGIMEIPNNLSYEPLTDAPVGYAAQCARNDLYSLMTEFDFISFIVDDE